MDEKQLLREIEFKAVRSSGAGGQHVNKVASKVELHFNVSESLALSAGEKFRLEKKESSRLTNAGKLILQCEESRSQHINKDLVIKRFLRLVREGIKKPKIRKKTGVPKAAKLIRLRKKKMHSEKKSNRRDPLKE